MKDHDVPQLWLRPLPVVALAILVGGGVTFLLWRGQPDPV